ncbi:MAG: 50S ribosomal protein L22 [bacterium]
MATDTGYRIIAKASKVKGCPNKLRRYARLISGMPVEQALAILSVMPSPNAKKVYKVVHQARANAENNYQKDAAELVISEIYINEGPRMKRFQPRARGRAFPILKRSSHIFLELGPAPAKPEQRASKKETK